MSRGNSDYGENGNGCTALGGMTPGFTMNATDPRLLGIFVHVCWDGCDEGTCTTIQPMAFVRERATSRTREDDRAG